MSGLFYDVYIAGSMHGRFGADVLDERERAKTICYALGLTYYDPAEDETISPSRLIDSKPNMKRMHWYVRKDFKHLDRCKAIVVLTGDNSSSGTAWEMAYMHFIYGRPIVLVAPRMANKQLTNFTTVLATKICATQTQAFTYIKRRLNQCRI